MCARGRTTPGGGMKVKDGAALRSRRQRMGLSQRELAYLCRPCSQTTIYLLETGRMQTLSSELAVRIAKRLDLGVEALFEERPALADADGSALAASPDDVDLPELDGPVVGARVRARLADLLDRLHVAKYCAAWAPASLSASSRDAPTPRTLQVLALTHALILSHRWADAKGSAGIRACDGCIRRLPGALCSRYTNRLDPKEPVVNKRPETKVLAAAAGASVISGLILGILGVTVFGVPFDADHSDAAIKAVPGFLSLAISGAVTFLLGYYAPRTHDSEREHGTGPAAPPQATRSRSRSSSGRPPSRGRRSPAGSSSAVRRRHAPAMRLHRCDRTDRHRSGHGLDDPRTRPFRFGTVTTGGTDRSRSGWSEHVRKVEALGFSTLVVADHFVNRTVCTPDWLRPRRRHCALAATSTTTTSGIQWYWHERRPRSTCSPAGEWSSGIGAGWSSRSTTRSDPVRDGPTRASRFEEAVGIIRRLQSGRTGHVRGRVLPAPKCELSVEPVQKPIPMLLGAAVRG